MHTTSNSLGHPSSASQGVRPALALQFLILAVVVLFYIVHFVDLSADFPNFSPWMDWSKYTDEGWYGDAAIRHFLLGHWYVPGDFNPAVALPVWPVLEGIVFWFSGVSLVAARALTLAIFGATLLSSWLLLARSGQNPSRLSITPSVAALLLAVSPFCFVFTRLAILEPLLVLLTLLALLAAQSVQIRVPTRTANIVQILALGLLIPLIILTKTTGLFLIPAIFWMLFASTGYRIIPLLRVGIPVALIAAALWAAYFLLIVRPHFLLDYRYLFSANAYTGMTRQNCFSTIWWTLHGGIWIGRAVYLTACSATLVALISFRRLREYPLIPALLLWAAGYAAFLAYHNNLQPRYYLVIAIPLTLLIPVVFRDLILPRLASTNARTAAIAAAVVILALILVPEARETLHFVRHPVYTFVDAAERIHHYIAVDEKKHPSHNPLILSISGSDLSLMTGLHSICDDFGTAELADRARRYKPGWYVAWNLIEDDKMDSLTPLFHVTRVATFPAMDDQDRNLLILYRLDLATAEQTHPSRPHRSRRLGQQPSALQLGH